LILARYHPDGSLDASFGAGGIVIVGESPGDFSRRALLLQPDRKLVAADGRQLFRFNPDGTLDTSFGDGGRVGAEFGGPGSLQALVLQPDGKLVAAGGTVDFLLTFQPRREPRYELRHRRPRGDRFRKAQ